MAENTSLNERADALERKMSDELDVLISKSALFNMADGKLRATGVAADLATKYGKHQLIDDDRRLPTLPATPTLLAYSECRPKASNHLSQSPTPRLDAASPGNT